MRRAIAVVVVILTGVAHAEAPPPGSGLPGAPNAPVEPVPPPVHRAAVTFGPILLVLPVVEVNAEFSVAPKIGVEGILGGGKVTPKNADGTASSVTATVYEAGVSGRYYVLGDFDSGLQLGAQMLYVKASGASGGVTAVADGLGISPFAGYKHTFGIGFVLEIEGGATFTAYRASASTGATDSAKKVIPLLRINVGWAF